MIWARAGVTIDIVDNHEVFFVVDEDRPRIREAAARLLPPGRPRYRP